MNDTDPGDAWQMLVAPFADGAYATVQGQVRTFVLHQHLMRHLPSPPAEVLDVGGGAAHQSLPLARLGYRVTVLDSSPAMLAKAEQRLAGEPAEVRERVRLIEADGASAAQVAGAGRYAGVLCHGVLMYLPDPAPVVAALGACAAPGGLVSIMTLNAATMAVRHAVSGRWAEALASFDATEETGVLGLPVRGDTVDGLTALLAQAGVPREAWYGVLLFTDWRELSPADTDVRAVGAVELEASGRDPYRQLTRAFHLVARRPV